MLSSVARGFIISPVENYSIALPIDPDHSSRPYARSDPVYPPIVLPPRNESGPSIVSIHLNVFYTFEGARINWHPNCDWNIYYEIGIQDDIGDSVRLVSRSWHGKEFIEWVEPLTKQIIGLSRKERYYDIDNGNKNRWLSMRMYSEKRLGTGSLKNNHLKKANTTDAKDSTSE
ncbi:MAG: hypothetical protein GY797_21470 [Deltaproteobacteria bacterium]|nr:hypothetical protein [Deltaproteobacteria bacterium]